MKKWIPLTALLLPLAAGAALEPGKDHRVKWPGTEHGFIRLSIPAAAARGTSLPVLFWFHGTGGQPSIILGHGSHYGGIHDTGRYGLDAAYKEKLTYIRDHLIVIGMSYPKREPGAERFPVERIWETCREVRDWLHPQVAVDKSRCYMGGFSRGGNNSFRTAIRPPPDLAGIAMFAGGVPSGFRFDPKERFNRSFHVLLGLGELDSNFWSGHIAVRFFKSRGATVTYDEWLNGTHGSLAISPRVVDWFELRLREKEPAYIQGITKALINEYQAITTDLSGLPRFLALREMLGDPRLHHVDPRMRQMIQTNLQSMTKLPVIRRPYRDLQAWTRQVNQEVDLYHYGNVTEQALLHLNDRYKKYVKDYGGGLATRNALQGQARVMHYLEIGMFNKSEEAQRYDDEPAPKTKSPREQLTDRLAQLEQQLKDTERAYLDSRAPRIDHGNDRITLRVPSRERVNTNGLKLQIQQVRTQLAGLPKNASATAQPKIAPPPKHYQPVTDEDREQLQQAIKDYLSTHPADRFTLRSGPVF